MATKKATTPQAPTERVYLIDSMSHIFRAYFAPMSGRIDPLMNSQGQVTQAVFVFTNMLRKLLSDEKPHYIAAVFVSNDKDMCQLVRDPFILCMRQNSQNVKRKEPVPPVEWCDEAWVENKFGVPPSQIIDLLGLMGDSVDNIPGAPGIGAKGAVQLVKQFGSIENALKHWEEVKHKTYRESLRDNAELIRQSRELATIRTDVNIELDLEKLRSRPPDRAAAYQLFRELEFQALTREFSDAASGVEGVSAPRRYRIIRKRAELDSLVRGLWDAEHWGFAISDSSPVGGGQQASVRDAGSPAGVAIS